MRAVFPPDALERVAAVIRARRRRTQVAARSLSNLRSRTTSGGTEATSRDEPNERVPGPSTPPRDGS